MKISEIYFKIHAEISKAMVSGSAYRINEVVIDFGKTQFDSFGLVFDIIHELYALFVDGRYHLKMLKICSFND